MLGGGHGGGAGAGAGKAQRERKKERERAVEIHGESGVVKSIHAGHEKKIESKKRRKIKRKAVCRHLTRPNQTGK